MRRILAAFLLAVVAQARAATVKGTIILLAPRISVEQTPNCMPEMTISHPSVCPFLQPWKSAVTDWSIFGYSIV
jgi:hypothetical protein